MIEVARILATDYQGFYTIKRGITRDDPANHLVEPMEIVVDFEMFSEKFLTAY